MRRALLAVMCLAACGKSEAPEPPAASATTVERAAEGAELASPAEAEDLDPAADMVKVALTAAATPDGRFAYASNGGTGQIPGPTIRAKVGDTLIVELDNQLDTPTTIHWHGVHVPWEMDGITWMQDPIGPGESFTYTFELTHAGTFWYHPHFDTARQVDLGLYGALIVEDPAEPKADRELVLVFDTAAERAAELPHDVEGHNGVTHPLPEAWRVNDAEEPRIALTAGERVRVRMINASNGGFLDLRGGPLRVIAGDQGLNPGPTEPESLLLGPGDRAEVEWLVADGFTLETAAYAMYGGATGRPARPLLHVDVETPGTAPAPLGFAWSGEAPTPDPGYADIVYVFAGSDAAGTYVINGEVYPDVTVETLPLGAEAILEIRNLSESEHPFHLHGHSFEVLSRNGTPPAAKTVEDTIDVRIRERVRLRLVADNPGDWMAHCHILPHADRGMMTVLRVQP